MKVLIFTNEYPPYTYGGAGVHVEHLSWELAKLLQVEVRCFGDQDQAFKNLRVKGFTVDTQLYGCPKHLRSVLGATQRSVDINSVGLDADIIHCHTWYTHLGGILAKLTYGTPLVITTHSLEPLRPWKREQLARGYDFSLWVERTALEMADAIIAVSQGTKRDILSHFAVDPGTIHVIHNGIDPEEFQPRTSTHALVRFGINPSQPYVLFVGRITRQKGIMYLVRAIQYLDPTFQIVLAAGAPDTEDLANEMRAAVENASTERSGIIWIQDMVPKQDLIELYSHAAVFCCPSIYEPFGIINLEAMACETPVVATRVGGIPEVVVDGETGILIDLDQKKEAPFSPLDSDRFSRDLAQAINRLMADPALRSRMAIEARKRAQHHFSWSSIANSTKELYQSLVQASSSDPHRKTRHP